MKNKLVSAALLSGLLLAGGIGAAMAKSQVSKIFHRHHKKTITVTQEQAQAAALKRVPGTVADSKKEIVKGKTVYQFDITTAKGQKEDVWVNSSGKVTKVSMEKMAKPTKTKTNTKTT
ncbi:MAG: PepSY domain-containing protein [Pyrinomonadaceae bacterium]